MRVGIDAVAVAVPESYLELADLARARSVPESKYLEGLGVQRMAIAGPHEDPVALAANAARRLFATSGAEPEAIQSTAVSTPAVPPKHACLVS